MTFAELVKVVAIDRECSEKYAHEFVSAVFDKVKANVMRGDGRNRIPQFGTFNRRFTKAGIRSVMGKPRTVPASSRVGFKASVGAKRSE